MAYVGFAAYIVGALIITVVAFKVLGINKDNVDKVFRVNQ